MRHLRFFGVTVLILSLAACSAKKDEKKDGEKKDGDKKELTNAERIVGTWEGTQGDLKGGTIEFKKDGTFKAFYKKQQPKDGKKDAKDGKDGAPKDGGKLPEFEEGPEGTYKIDGDKFELNIKGEKSTNTGKIKTLNETNFILVQENDKEMEFKKK